MKSKDLNEDDLDDDLKDAEDAKQTPKTIKLRLLLFKFNNARKNYLET